MCKKLVFIFGDAATGKMTVGQELMKITDLRLFHNHMSIEPVLEIFGYFNKSAIKGIRDTVFREFAKSDCYGLIFTYMFAFDTVSDYEYIDYVKSIFAPYGTEIYYVELLAPQNIRLERNKTENRLNNKPSKRNTEESEQRLLRDSERHRFESRDGELPIENHIKIENSFVSPQDAAKIIKEMFGL